MNINEEIKALRRITSNQGPTGYIRDHVILSEIAGVLYLSVDRYTMVCDALGLNTFDVDDWEKAKTTFAGPSSREVFKDAYRLARTYIKGRTIETTHVGFISLLGDLSLSNPNAKGGNHVPVAH